MAAKSRIRSVAISTVATTIAVIALGASPALADTGRVYFDARNNAAAGETNMLFNGAFSGTDNVGLGRSVMPNLITGSANVAAGREALWGTTTGSDNTATGTRALASNTTGNENIATGTGP